jgi:hypothetical protein
MDPNGVAGRRGAGRGPGRGRTRRAAAVTAGLLAAAGLAVAGASSAALAAPGNAGLTAGLTTAGNARPAAAALAAPGNAQPATASWRIVKRVPGGSFDVVIAVGKNGGWAFDNSDGSSPPTAWQRSGSRWTKVAFPGKANESVVAAGASSSADVWAFPGGAVPSRALHWNGRAWTVQRTFPGQVGGAAVVNRSDVWVFGEPFLPGAGLGTWHYNGHTWSRVASGHGLEGGSALSPNNIWAFGGVDVAHWNGSTWSRTSVASLLPAKQELNNPAVYEILALARDNVYAIGSGNLEDEGGPTVILHWNGHRWSRLAEGQFGIGWPQISSDGHGGLWLPMPGSDGQKSYLVHYSAGHLTPAALPGGPNRISIFGVALIPGTSSVLAGGNTHAIGQPGVDENAVLLQYAL